MKVFAVIIDPEEVKKILQYLENLGRPPPGLDLASCNCQSVPFLSAPVN
jgi:hypothetical protein